MKFSLLMYLGLPERQSSCTPEPRLPPQAHFAQQALAVCLISHFPKGAESLCFNFKEVKLQ